jgi:putative transposase
VLQAPEMALAQRRPAGVIPHSDHGSQYTAVAFGARSRKVGIRPSMGTIGACFDNARCESFFAILERERLDRHRFPTQADARRAISTVVFHWFVARSNADTTTCLQAIEVDPAGHSAG